MLVVFLFFLVEISDDQTRPAAEPMAAAQWSSMFPLGLWVGGWGEEPVVVAAPPITRGASSQQLLKSFFTTRLRGGAGQLLEEPRSAFWDVVQSPTSLLAFSLHKAQLFFLFCSKGQSLHWVWGGAELGKLRPS